MEKLIVWLLILSVLASGCIQSEKAGEASKEADVAAVCIQLCEAEKTKGASLENGPCLSDGNPDWTADDWVCDVAHFPRQDIDNKPENQCREFGEGKAHHFIEVDPNCQFIKRV